MDEEFYEEFSEVELPNGVIVQARLGTGMPPKSLNKSAGALVPIQKQQGVETEMNTLEEKIEKMKQDLDSQAAAILAAADEKLAAARVAPAPVSKSAPQLSGLSFSELQALTRAGKLSLNDFNTEMDLRRRNPKAHQLVKEATEHATDLVTAARLAAVVKEKYMSERATEKRELIIKTAVDGSIEKMSDYDFALLDPNLSNSKRRELVSQRDAEAQFQLDLLGDSEAVGKYYLAHVARPKQDPQAEAQANLIELAKGTDEVAVELQSYFEAQQSIKRAKAQEKRTYNIAVRTAGA